MCAGTEHTDQVTSQSTEHTDQVTSQSTEHADQVTSQSTEHTDQGTLALVDLRSSELRRKTIGHPLLPSKGHTAPGDLLSDCVALQASSDSIGYIRSEGAWP